MQRVFTTTSIPYVNARPHIGHALEYVQADAYVRFHKLLGDDAFLLAGTDDNALKNVQAAEALGKPVKEYVEENAQNFKKLHEALGIGIDDFIRTSDVSRHFGGAQKLWRACEKDIYAKEYRGLYCVGCEEFKTEKDLINGECPEHPHKKLEIVEEKNYFFKLSSYQDKLLALIESDTLRISPEKRKNEIIAFIRSGLEDFSISRLAIRAKGWGVPVPGDASQVMYVWFDALANYITALDYEHEGPAYKKYWLEADKRIHFIGKGINRFHSVYWPAMLLSAGIPLPTDIFVHGYINVAGQKISKSVGNTVDPMELIRTFGGEALRYYYLRHVNAAEDSDFTFVRFKEDYNANLANGIGNLAARIMKLAEDNLSAPVPKPKEIDFPEAFKDEFGHFEFNRAVDLVWSRIQFLDQKITLEEPFKLVKSDPKAGGKVIADLVLELYSIAQLLGPFLPETSEKIQAAVLANKKPENLFPRID
ncbi:methionine--tRNA ligase [Candidatus Kaiserbacteria bacterium]|nr:methionine--tRNA ligase [Candidatus Kaiserbacteria bacterium]